MDFQKTVEKFETRVKSFLQNSWRNIVAKFSLCTLAYNKMFTAVSSCRTYYLLTKYAIIKTKVLEYESSLRFKRFLKLGFQVG